MPEKLLIIPISCSLIGKWYATTCLSFISLATALVTYVIDGPTSLARATILVLIWSLKLSFDCPFSFSYKADGGDTKVSRTLSPVSVTNTTLVIILFQVVFDVTVSTWTEYDSTWLRSISFIVLIPGFYKMLRFTTW